MHAEQSEAPKLQAQVARKRSLLEPLRDVRQHPLANVGAHGVANQTLFVGEQPRDVDEVDRVRHADYRLRTRASLSKSASVERSN